MDIVVLALPKVPESTLRVLVDRGIRVKRIDNIIPPEASLSGKERRYSFSISEEFTRSLGFQFLEGKLLTPLHNQALR